MSYFNLKPLTCTFSSFLKTEHVTVPIPVKLTKSLNFYCALNRSFVGLCYMSPRGNTSGKIFTKLSFQTADKMMKPRIYQNDGPRWSVLFDCIVCQSQSHRARC